MCNCMWLLIELHYIVGKQSRFFTHPDDCFGPFWPTVRIKFIGSNSRWIFHSSQSLLTSHSQSKSSHTECRTREKQRHTTGQKQTRMKTHSTKTNHQIYTLITYMDDIDMKSNNVWNTSVTLFLVLFYLFWHNLVFTLNECLCVFVCFFFVHNLDWCQKRHTVRQVSCTMTWIKKIKNKNRRKRNMNETLNINKTWRILYIFECIEKKMKSFVSRCERYFVVHALNCKIGG